jgi:hypothetical protein
MEETIDGRLARFASGMQCVDRWLGYIKMSSLVSIVLTVTLPLPPSILFFFVAHTVTLFCSTNPKKSVYVYRKETEKKPLFRGFFWMCPEGITRFWRKYPQIARLYITIMRMKMALGIA